jgi:hypothetical protein
MPVCEFHSKKYKNIFETLTFSPKKEKSLSCPKCEAKTTKKIMSVFAGGKTDCSSYASTSCSPA